MGLDHSHDHHHHHDTKGNIKMAFFLNFAFTIIELIGGFWTNSMAIISDALHDLGDSFSLGFAWYMEKVSDKGPDHKYSFGYARFSLLGALINSFILVGGSILIFVRAVPRIFRPEEVNPNGMLLFAILGIFINGLAVLRLKKGESLNEKVVSWHLMEDVLGWVVILVASIILKFYNIPILDPLLSIFITLYVLIHVIKNLREILNVFLQGVPKNFSIHDVEREMVEKTGVLAAHHTHIWSMEGEKNYLSTHVIVGDEIDRKAFVSIKQNVRDLMKKNGIGHVTIEVEFESENCKEKDCC